MAAASAPAAAAARRKAIGSAKHALRLTSLRGGQGDATPTRSASPPGVGKSKRDGVQKAKSKTRSNRAGLQVPSFACSPQCPHCPLRESGRVLLTAYTPCVCGSFP